MVFPRPTNRYMVDIGHRCNAKCIHCYWLHELNAGTASFKDVEKLKGEIFLAQQKGNNYIEFSGGEPTIHPDIIDLINHCSSLQMKCGIITNGQAGKTITEKILATGLDDWLISIHHGAMKSLKGEVIKAMEKQERFLKQITDAESTFRFNCCMLKSNQSELVDLAKWAVEWKPRIFNFISFNPHNEWQRDVDGTKNMIADLDVIEEQLCEAIPILLDAGIGVNVRYYPMCRLPEAFRMHVCNDLQVMMDPYEWANYCDKPKTFKNYYEAGLNMSKNVEWKGQPCLRCDLLFICGGINSAFFRADGRTGVIKAVKLEGVPKDDFYHYRRNNTACLIDRYPKCAATCIATIADDSNAGYIPVFIRDTMENRPECDIRILSLCNDLSEVKKIVDRYIGHGILESCISDSRTEVMEYKDDEKYDKLKSTFGINGVQNIEFVDIEASKIIPDKKVHDLYRLCGFIDKRIEESYLSMTAPPLNPTVKDVVKPNPKPKPQFEHFPGELLIFTACDERYQWYIPMFIKSINMTMPSQAVSVLLVGKKDNEMLYLCDKYCSNYEIAYDQRESIPGQYGEAAYRFLIDPPTNKKFDYFLITDVDMLMYKERFSIVDIHMHHLKKDETECYENYISEVRAGCPRLPGIMFVTNDWWKKTEQARERELKTLLENGAHEYYYDEMMLGRIVQSSDLPLSTVRVKLWRSHGVHLGDWRLNMSRKMIVQQNVYQKMHIEAMLKNEEFMSIVSECSKRIDIMDKILKKWRLLLK